MTCGIYEIVNKSNGKRYVGSSVNIEARFRTHLRELNKGTHHASHLQRSFNIYGEESYFLNILTECTPDDLISEEQKEMDKGFDYNSSPTAGSSLGFKHTLETRRKQSQERIRRYQECEKYRNHLLSLSKMPKTEEWKRSASKRLLGKKKTPKHSENMAKARSEICATRVMIVREMRKSGMQLKDIPDKVNLSWAQCQRICSGERYQWAYDYNGPALSDEERMESIRLARSRPINLSIFSFLHPEHGYRECTQWDLKNEFPELTGSKVSRLCSGKQKSHKGWTLKKPG